MKILTLFDEDGTVLAMMHKPPSAFGLVARFRPESRQQMLELEVPEHLHKLEPTHLHNSVRVDLSGSSPRLVER